MKAVSAVHPEDSVGGNDLLSQVFQFLSREMVDRPAEFAGDIGLPLVGNDSL
jgi:hypothetical protein